MNLYEFVSIDMQNETHGCIMDSLIYISGPYQHKNICMQMDILITLAMFGSGKC